MKEQEEAAVIIVEQISQVQLCEEIVDNFPDGVVCMDEERSGGPEGSEIIQLSYVSRSISGNSFIVPERGIDP